jgi:hypothetical protein
VTVNAQKAVIQRLVDGMSEWPDSWKMDRGDIAAGKDLVTVFRSFVEDLAESGLALSTMRRHVANLWLLGGEIVSQINRYPEQRQRTAMELIVFSVDDEGGPLSTHLQSDNDRRSFDGTCRKLHTYLASDRI